MTTGADRRFLRSLGNCSPRLNPLPCSRCWTKSASAPKVLNLGIQAQSRRHDVAALNNDRARQRTPHDSIPIKTAMGYETLRSRSFQDCSQTIKAISRTFKPHIEDAFPARRFGSHAADL